VTALKVRGELADAVVGIASNAIAATRNAANKLKKIDLSFRRNPTVDKTSGLDDWRMSFPLFEWENGAPGHTAELGATQTRSDSTCLGNEATSTG
jgi:hypothetical protein